MINSLSSNSQFEIRFAYAYNELYQAGVEKYLKYCYSLDTLCVLGNDNLFYRLDSSGINKLVVFFCKLPFILIRKTGIYSFYNFIRLWFYFRKINPDILHINNGGYPGARSCLVAVFSAKMAGIRKIVFNVNNIAQNQKNVLERAVDKYINNNVDYFVTASALAQNKLVACRRFCADKVLQIFNAAPQDKPTKVRSEMLDEFNITEEKFVIVTVALLTGRKGQLYLLQAIVGIREIAPAVFKNIVLILVGDGEDRVKLERYISDKNLSKQILITGYRNDYCNFISAADLFVLPSISNEDMPLVILTAMSLGKAIISTKVAGITEEIRDGVDGVLVEPKDVALLASSIVNLYNSKELREQYGLSSRNRYLDLFSLDIIMSQYCKLYMQLV